VNRGAERLNKRIEELLDLSRGEIGMLTLEKRDLDLDAFLRESAGEAAQEFAAHGQIFKIDLPPSLPNVRADDERLHQVLSNLLNNAMKYTRKGDTVTLRAKVDGEFAVIEVKDTGPGIPGRNSPTCSSRISRATRNRRAIAAWGWD
jgi:signal transduction histidine kinase